MKDKKSINKLLNNIEKLKDNLDSELYVDLINSLNELEKYKKLEKEGKLIEFPCSVGDYVQFNNGSILPVVSVSKNISSGINICCQNGNIISMKNFKYSWAKRFISKEEYENK